MTQLPFIFSTPSAFPRAPGLPGLLIYLHSVSIYSVLPFRSYRVRYNLARLTVRGRTNISLAFSTIPFIPSNPLDPDLPYGLTHKSRFSASIKRVKVATRLAEAGAGDPLSEAREVGFRIIPPHHNALRVVDIENRPQLHGYITVKYKRASPIGALVNSLSVQHQA
jgi:hypothetical protein